MRDVPPLTSLVPPFMPTFKPWSEPRGPVFCVTHLPEKQESKLGDHIGQDSCFL